MRQYYSKWARCLQNLRSGLSVILCISILLLLSIDLFAQSNQDGVSTYMNPVLPGSHPDQTLLKVGNDFYTAGSSFHWTPNFPIYHSTDLVHWEIISNVVSPDWSILKANDGPKDGTWQGALAYFDNKYWAFFFIHGAGQFFCTASDPKGPWTSPVQVQGSIGYDNAVFVDDDGRAYMLMKNGPDLNRIQEIGTNGQLTGPVLNMDWVNQDGRFSWAEGPKMCKRNGRYYYFVAGNVYGGQYVLSSPTLTANESSWTVHGDFFRGNASGPFTGPNHITNPVQIADGTWWCLAHSYGNNGWQGQGRQSMLFQVHWDANGVPYSNNPNGAPLSAPDLPSKGVNYEFPDSDFFTGSSRKPEWYFHNTSNIQKASVSARPGYLRLTPGTGTTHILQRDPAKQYSLVTKVDINATSNGQHAGLRMMNGEDLVFARVYSGYNNGKKIGISFSGTTHEVNNNVGNTVWLKLVRNQHNITGFYSADGLSWMQIGNAVNIATLDEAQTNDNAWVGTSIGLYATGQTADFDQFSFNHGFDPISIASYYHYNNTSISSGTITNSASGAWCMLPGVTLESDGSPANRIVVSAASANSNGTLEVWIDNIGSAGTQIASIPISNTGGTSIYQDFSAAVSVSGQHDVYFRFIGAANVFRLNTVRFVSNGGPLVNFTAPLNNLSTTAPATLTLQATATDGNGTISNVKFYNGTTLLFTDNSAPYSYEWTNVPAGNYELRAVATDNEGNESEDVINIRVNVPQGPYSGAAHSIPGTVQLEEFDLGGNGFAYQDASPGSETGVNFRTDEDVDIEECTDAGAGYNLGWTTAGEWLEYTVNVEASGTYDLDLRVACNADNRTLSVEVGGVAIANNVAIPNTTGWQIWTTVTVNEVELTAGEQIMRITIGAEDYINLNYVSFTGVNVSVPPTVSITSPANNSDFTILETVNITATASDADGTVSGIQFYAGSSLLGADNTSPYSFDWSGMKPGSYSIAAVATDNDGVTASSQPVTINIEAVQAPFNGVPHPVPGRIEAEEYDLGGEGLGYHEANANGNEGGATLRNDEVDIEMTQDLSGIHNVGYILNGEWLEYTVNVSATRAYDLDLRVAADGDGKVLHLEVDGVDVSGPVNVPNTGGWQVWETVSLSGIDLAEGEHVIRLVFDSDYMNINYLELKDVVTAFEEKGLHSINVYPNPFQDESIIKVTGSFTYELYTAQGVLAQSGKGEDQLVFGSELPQGIYTIKVIQNDQQKVTTLIKY